MEHRNTPFTGHVIDTQTGQQGQPLHPEPCIFFGNFPQPINNNSNIHHPSLIPTPLFYGVPQHHYNHPYMFPNHGMVGIMMDGYGNNTPYVDIKRKNVVGPTPSVGPSESDVISASVSMDWPPHSGSQVAMSTRNNRLNMMSVHESRLVQGGFVGPPVAGLLPGNMYFGASNVDVGAFGGWGTHAPIQYFHGLDMSASMNGANSTSLSGFYPPPFVQGQPNLHHLPPPPMQDARGVYSSVNLSSQVAQPRISVINSTNPSLLPLSQISFGVYQPQQREIMLDSSARPRTLPHLRVLPEDEVAILELPGYGESIDQHSDMRLDIDHMSYEELLALGDHIGCVGTGLPEGFIRNHLKISTFASRPSLEGEVFPDEQINFCAICQTDYEDGEDIGTVDCGHEYHKGCIKKWLLLKNTCPVCKSTALKSKAKGL